MLIAWYFKPACFPIAVVYMINRGNRNQRLLWRVNLDLFTLHHCAINCGFGSWISSLVIGSCGYVSAEAICEFVHVKSRYSSGHRSLSRFVLAIAFLLAARSNVVSSYVQPVSRMRTSRRFCAAPFRFSL